MKQIKLNENLYLQPYENGIIIHLPDDESLKIDEKTLFIDLLYEIKKSGAYGKEEIYKQIFLKHDVSEDEFNELFQILIDHNIVKFKTEFTHTLTNKELTKFDRQIKSFATLKGNNIDDAIYFQEKIKNSHVGILGIGGVGSYVAYGLTSMGIGKLTLIEHDHIDLSNTARQMLYNEDDIGKQKLTVAEKKLKLVNPLVKITTVNRRVTSSQDLEPYLDSLDILILCADTPRGKIVYVVDEACQNKQCSFIFGLPSFNQITCGPLIIPKKTRSYREIFPIQTEIQKSNLSDSERETTDLINSGLVATIIDPYNAIAGKLVVLEVVKFLTNFSPCQLINRVFNFDTNTLSSCITEV